MGATILRVVKWLLLAWAATSLLGVATIAGVGGWQYRAYAQAAPRIAPAPTPEQQARGIVDTLWPGQHAFVSLEHRHAGKTASARAFTVTAVRVRPIGPANEPGAARYAHDPATWPRADAATPGTRVAIDLVAPNLRGDGPAWLPTADQLRGPALRAEVGHLVVSEGSLDTLTLYALRPADGMLFIFTDSWGPP